VRGIDAARNYRLCPTGERIKGGPPVTKLTVVFANLARFRMIERNA